MWISKSVQLQRIRNYILKLFSLQKRGSSRSKRRRGKKEDKGTASNVRDSGSAGQELLTQEGAQEMRKNCRRSSKYPKRSIELKNSDISDSQNSQDAEMVWKIKYSWLTVPLFFSLKICPICISKRYYNFSIDSVQSAGRHHWRSLQTLRCYWT